MLEIIKLDNSIKLDIRYAREDNFVGKAVYSEARAFLQIDAAKAVVRVNKKLSEANLGLVIFDAYRPWSVTKLFWETVTEDQRKFVADPKVGSVHNRGCAVDLSLYYLESDQPVEMPSDFDEFNEKASPDYEGGTRFARKNRDRLRTAMESEGFTVNPNEWWHYDYESWEGYAIYDIPFSDMIMSDDVEDQIESF